MRPNVTAKPNNTINCVVKALVDATPISAPARVYNTNSLLRGSADSITLQMDKLCLCPNDCANFNASIVSSVSPD